LANLQFQSWPPRQHYGTFSASGVVVGGGLQDNGVAYCVIGNEPTPWRQIYGGDGMLGIFVRGDFIFYNNSSLGKVENGGKGGVSLAVWSSGALIDKGVVPMVLKGKVVIGNQPFALLTGKVVAEAVPAPALKSKFDPKYMISAVGAIGSTVYGLFWNASGDVHWEQLGTISISSGDFITSVGSYDGLSIFVGTNNGNIFRLNAKDAKSIDISPVTASTITRIIVDASVPPRIEGYALCNDGLGTILQLVNASTLNNRGSWSKLDAGGPAKKTLFDIAVDWSSRGIAYVATEDKVYVSSNEGVIWDDFSNGLPRVPRCSGLCIVLPSSLLLSTCGRSVWVTE
jgi:hypothetical protein